MRLILALILPLSPALFPGAASGQVPSQARTEPLPGALSEAPGATPETPFLLADSAAVRLAEIDLARARDQERRTDFWHRLIPSVELAASFSTRDILFFDPSTAVPVFLPKDSYRLTIRLSVTGVFNAPEHLAATAQLLKRTEEYRAACSRLEQSRAAFFRRLQEGRTLLALCEEELALKKDVASFDELRFRQGSIAFDVLQRSRLEVVAARKSVERARSALSGLEGGDGTIPREGGAAPDD